jgi:PAS domain S-box-containing protein
MSAKRKRAAAPAKSSSTPDHPTRHPDEEARPADRRSLGATEIVITATDAKGRILAWNRAARTHTGYTLDEVRGRFLFELLAPRDRPLMKTAYATGALLESDSTPEWSVLDKKGREIPLRWTFSALKDGAGDVASIIAAAQDRRERRRMTAQLLPAEKLAALGVMADDIAHEMRNPLAICSAAAQLLLEEDVSPEMTHECAERIVKAVQCASSIIDDLLRSARPATHAGREDA